MLSFMSKVLWCAPSKHTGVLRAARMMSSGGTSLEDRLKDHFNNVMKCSKIPLFANFEAYQKSLPVRLSGTSRVHRPLYRYPYWAYDSDVQFLAQQLEEPGVGRAYVKYMSAPAGSGKTGSILPAFLKSAEGEGGFTHYVYMAFQNNDDRYFVVQDDDNQAIENSRNPMKLGATFIYKCFYSLLQADEAMFGQQGVAFVEEQQAEEKLMNCLQSIPEKAMILVHLDEHWKMCERKTSDHGCKGAQFSRGAMQALAMMPMVTVVATYTQRPPLPPGSSSEVCRYPVVKPSLDVHTVMEEVEELKFPTLLRSEKGFDRLQERLWTTLCLRLALKLLETGLMQLHDRGIGRMKRLLTNYEEATKEGNTEQVLRKCLKICEVSVPQSLKNNYATTMLLGIEDSSVEYFEEQVSDLIVGNTGTDYNIADCNIVTCSLMGLLGMIDPIYPVYNTGAGLFVDVLTEPDYLSQTALEAVYSWTLSCRSAVSGSLKFNHRRFVIECNELLPGRVLAKDNTIDVDFVEDMPENTIYYVMEGKGSPTHPLCDLFFKTKKRELVLIDVTGGSDQLVLAKKKRLVQFIDKTSEKDLPFSCHGVVLAPVATGHSETHQNVSAVCGIKAKRLMGGLVQLFRWVV